MAGLSRSNEKPDAVKEIVLKEVVSFLKEISGILQKSPSDAQKAIASIVTISDSQAQKSQEAKDYIARHETLVANVKTLQANANSSLTKAEQRNDDAKKIEAQNTEKTVSLAKKEAELSAISRSHVEKDNEHKRLTSLLDDKQKQLLAFEQSLKAKESLVNTKDQEITDRELKLRERAKHLKTVAESF